MSDIFLSYAKEDRAQAQVLAKALEAKGWSRGKIERYHRSMKSVIKLQHYYFPWELEAAVRDLAIATTGATTSRSITARRNKRALLSEIF